jgi:hypothetical protein
LETGLKIAQASVNNSVWFGGGEMEARIRAFEWSNTPLGPIQQWPQSLRTVSHGPRMFDPEGGAVGVVVQHGQLAATRFRSLICFRTWSRTRSNTEAKRLPGS